MFLIQVSTAPRWAPTEFVYASTPLDVVALLAFMANTNARVSARIFRRTGVVDYHEALDLPDDAKRTLAQNYAFSLRVHSKARPRITDASTFEAALAIHRRFVNKPLRVTVGSK